MKKVKVYYLSDKDDYKYDMEKPVKMIAKNAIKFRFNQMGGMGGCVGNIVLIKPKFNAEYGCFIGKTFDGDEVSVFTSNLLTTSKVNLYAASYYKQAHSCSPRTDYDKEIVFELPASVEFDGFTNKVGECPRIVGFLDKD